MADQNGLSPPFRAFVAELALCVATYGDKGPALLWPAGAEQLPDLLTPAVRRGDAAGAGRGPAGSSGASPRPTDRLTAALGRLLDLRVRAHWHVLAPGADDGPWTWDGAECALTVVEGALRCHLRVPLRAAAPVLELRLRAGGTLFVPRGHDYRLSDVHTPTVLLALVLGDPR